MAGMLLQGGASALVGAGSAAQPPMTVSPTAATSAPTAGGIAFGGGATPVGAQGGVSSLFSLDGGSLAFWAHCGFLALLTFTYLSLPK